MRASLAALSGVLVLSAFSVTPHPARAQEVTFLSTQMRPLEEAQRARTQILNGAPVKTTYVPEEPPQLPVHLQADAQGSHRISLVGALHGELAPLVPIGLLAPLDDQETLLKQRGIPGNLATLAHLGGEHLMYVPWMQATYIMAASKKALQYLPEGAKLETLTYSQLGEWAANVQKATGQRVLGFPAGPTGLMARFLEGYLLPSLHRRHGGELPLAGRGDDVGGFQGAVGACESQFHQLQLHAGAAAVRRCVDRLGSRRAAAGRVPQAAE